MFSYSYSAQDIPACIEKLNKQTSLTITKFERAFEIKQHVKVYQFSVKSVRQCMDCQNGSVFYDANCNIIAYFLMGRGSNAFVENGYTAADFGKAGYPNIRYGSKEITIPNCIAKAISNTDSLKKAQVIRVVQVRIKDKILYGFEHQVDPKLINCKDCSTAITYYNSDCKPEVTFRVGGIAGIRADNGYTSSDYRIKDILKVLWKAN